MPTATLDDEDIKKALNHLTDYRFEINTIVSKKINEKGELEIFWSYKTK